METIVIAGGSGFIGKALSEQLVRAGYAVVILSRSPKPDVAPITQLQWDGQTLGPWASALDGARALINLTGRSIDCRFTEENKKEILESRLHSISVLGQAVRSCEQKPAAWIQAGSIATLGESTDEADEDYRQPAEGFSFDVSRQWESAFLQEDAAGMRKAFLRISVVLGKEGGALKTLIPLTQSFLGGAAGSGKQYMSWIHLEDMCRLFTWAMESSEVEGVYNATAPNPRANKDFMAVLRAVLKRPWSPPVPRFALNIGCKLMQNEPELVLSSIRAIPKKALDESFEFHFPELEPALRDIVK